RSQYLVHEGRQAGTRHARRRHHGVRHSARRRTDGIVGWQRSMSANAFDRQALVRGRKQAGVSGFHGPLITKTRGARNMIAVLAVAATLASSPASCESLKSLALPNTTIVAAEMVGAG